MEGTDDNDTKFDDLANANHLKDTPPEIAEKIEHAMTTLQEVIAYLKAPADKKTPAQIAETFNCILITLEATIAYLRAPAAVGRAIGEAAEIATSSTVPGAKVQSAIARFLARRAAGPMTMEEEKIIRERMDKTLAEIAKD
ncbi:hypothetical protein ACCS93_38340 [Rhizobium ruizarguesonis]